MPTEPVSRHRLFFLPCRYTPETGNRHNRAGISPCGLLARMVFCAVVSWLAACGQAPQQTPVVVAPDPEPVVSCPEVERPSCPEPEVVEKVVIKEVAAPLPPMATTAGEMHLPIVGGLEWVTLEPVGLRMQARMDTGLETSICHAEDIRLIEIDGQRTVRFTVTDAETGVPDTFQLPLKRVLRVRQAEGEVERRYVVRMAVILGEQRTAIDMALANRENFEHKLLLGRNFLVDTAIVDVSRRDLLTSPAAP